MKKNTHNNLMPLSTKLKPLIVAIFPLMILGINTPALAAVIEYADGVDSAAPIVLLDNSTQLQVTTGSATQSGVISGAFNLEKIGGGLLTLSGTNTYQGNTNISAGTLRLSGEGAISNTSGTVNVSAGATLNVAESESINGFAGAGTASINAGQTLTLGKNNGGGNFSGDITGAGNLVSFGNRTLSGNNTFTGTTVVGASTGNSTMTISATGDINESSAISIASAGTLNVNGGGNAAIGDGVRVSNAGNFVLTGSDETIGSISGAGNINLNGQTLTTGGDDTSSTLSGVISGSGGLSKQGTGTFTLSGANTYTGATAINAGVLQASNTSALGNNSAVTVGGGSLDLTTDLTIGSLAGSGNVTLNANTLTTGGNNTSTSYSGVLSGTGGFTKQGTGTTTLSGANTYTGESIIGAGKVILGNASGLGAGNNLRVNATLDLGGFTVSKFSTIVQVGTVENGTINMTGALQFDRATVGAVLSGTGFIRSVGSGNSTFSAINTYTGATEVNVGTLEVTSTGSILNTSSIDILSGAGLNVDGAGGNAIADTQTITNAGTFTLTGSDETIGSISGAGNINLNSNTLTTGGDDTTSTLSGVISGSGGLTKQGAGTFTLSGANTYTGATAINAGVLQASSSSALGNNSAVTVGGGSLDLTTDLTIGSLAGSGNVTLNANTLTTGGNNTSTSYSGVLSGTGAFTKQGTGTTTLSGANTYTGGTTINGGTISVTADNNLGNGGTLTLNGGTLQNTANLTTSRATTLDTSGGTFNTNSGTTLTHNGIISDTGSLTKSGSGTLVLSGANTYTGTTSITDGTLQVNGTSIADTSALSLSGTGDLTLTGSETIGSLASNSGTSTVTLGSNTLTTGNANNTTFKGVISGTGSLTKQGTGTTTLSGVNTYSGGTTINGGAIRINADNNLGSGILTLNGGTLQNTASFTTSRAVTLSSGGGTLNTDAGTTLTHNGVISGSGSLTKTGTGRTNLTGTNTYSGATTINAGTLSVNGSIINSTTTINAGGTLGGNGTVGSVNIAGGSFAPGNSIGTTNVTGNVDFTGSGNYNVEVNAAGATDLITATGTANLTSGIVNVQPEAGNYLVKTDYTILTAAGGLGGTSFASVNSNLAFLTPSLSYDANSVKLELERNDVTFSDIANTPNQTAVAGLLDKNIVALESISNNLLTLSSANAQQAFNSLSGVQHTQNQVVINNIGQQFQQLVLNHSRQNSNSTLAFNNQNLIPEQGILVADNSDSWQTLFNNTSTPALSQHGLWLQGFGGFGKTNDTANVNGADYQTNGVAFGADTNWHDFIIGVAGSYAQSNVDPFSGDSNIDSFQMATYANWQGDNLYINAMLGLGLHKVDTKRTVTVGSVVNTASSNYDSINVNSTVEAGKDIKLNTNTTLSPYLGLSYNHNTRDSFTETGAGVSNLRVKEQDQNSLRSTIGLRLSHDIKTNNNRVITPAASIAYVHEHLDNVSQLEARFSTVPASNFSIEGNDLDRDRLQMALGITGQLSENTTLNISYNGEIANSDEYHSVIATVKFVW